MKRFLVATTVAWATFGLLAASVPASAGDAAKKSRAKKGLLILFNGNNYVGEYLEIKKARTTMGEDMLVNSLAVFPGEAWEICEGPRFKGPCRIVNADENGLNNVRILSVRPAPVAPPAPPK
jgi:hypothetical protein